MQSIRDDGIRHPGLPSPSPNLMPSQGIRSADPQIRPIICGSNGNEPPTIIANLAVAPC